MGKNHASQYANFGSLQFFLRVHENTYISLCEEYDTSLFCFLPFMFSLILRAQIYVFKTYF